MKVSSVPPVKQENNIQNSLSSKSKWKCVLKGYGCTTHFFRVFQGLTDLLLLPPQLLLVQSLFSGFGLLLLQECQSGLFLQMWYNNMTCDHDCEKWPKYTFSTLNGFTIKGHPLGPVSNLWPFISADPQACGALLAVSESELKVKSDCICVATAPISFIALKSAWGA